MNSCVKNSLFSLTGLFKYFCLIVPLAILLIIWSCTQSSNSDIESITTEFKASTEVLLNPGKGWMLFYNPLAQTAETLAIGTVGYIRVDWAFVERFEGDYDWDWVDEQLINTWTNLGKPVAFGFMAGNSHSSCAYVAPRWMFGDCVDDAEECAQVPDDNPCLGEADNTGLTDGVPYCAEPREYGTDVFWQAVPQKFDHPVFLEKLKNFVTAFGQRYDGDPRIAWIEILSYGNWGEGHIWPWWQDGCVTSIPAAGLREHIQYFIDAFPTTPLVLTWGTEEYQTEVYNWAIDQGIGMRREGIFHNSDGSELGHCLGKSPSIFEYAPTNYIDVRTAENLAAFLLRFPDLINNPPSYADLLGNEELIIQTFAAALRACVEMGKPSYIALGGWMEESRKDAAVMLSEQTELVHELANRMGYHFHLSRATFPSLLRLNENTSIELIWENTGIAYIHIPCYVAFGLKDELGNITAPFWCESCDPSHWAPDELTTEQATVVFDDLAPGTYSLVIGLFRNKQENSPGIRLGTIGTDEQGWLQLGSVTI